MSSSMSSLWANSWNTTLLAPAGIPRRVLRVVPRDEHRTPVIVRLAQHRQHTIGHRAHRRARVRAAAQHRRRVHDRPRSPRGSSPCPTPRAEHSPRSRPSPRSRRSTRSRSPAPSACASATSRRSPPARPCSSTENELHAATQVPTSMRPSRRAIPCDGGTRLRQRRDPLAVRVQQRVDQRVDLVEVELGRGVRVEHRGVVHVLALDR